MARYGGKEFVLVLPETTKAKGGEVAERIMRNMVNLDSLAQRDNRAGK